MRLVQITDFHTSLPGEYPFDIDVRKNFKDILNKALSLHPDYLIYTGDLCFRLADKEVYLWQRKLFEELSAPYFVIPGNHDDAMVLRKIFHHLPFLRNDELFYRQDLNGFPCLFLDSGKGYLSRIQKNWLSEELTQLERAIVFMHHPPHLMGVPHMDARYFLTDKVEVQSIFKASGIPVYIFCGHYHVEKTFSQDNVHVFVTPSCFCQIDQSKEKFHIDHRNIALRVIDLKVNSVLTTVHYLPGNSATTG